MVLNVVPGSTTWKLFHFSSLFSFLLPPTCLLVLPTKARILFLNSFIEYSSLRDFGFLGKIICLFLYEDSRKMIFWLVLKLDRVILS